MHRLRLPEEFVSRQRSFKRLMEHQNHNLSHLLKALEVNDEKEIVHRLRQPFTDPQPGLITDPGLYRLSIKLWIKVVCHANPKIREAFRQIRIFNNLQTLLGEANVNLQFINMALISSLEEMIESYQKYNSERQNVLFYCLHVVKRIEIAEQDGRVWELNALLETLPKNETELSLWLQSTLSRIRKSRDLRSFDYEWTSRNWRQYYTAQLNDMYKKIHAAKHPDKKLEIPASFFKDEKAHIDSLVRHTDYALAKNLSLFVYHYFINAAKNIESRLLPFFKEVFDLFDRTAIFDYPADSGNWISIILHTENEDLLSQLLSKEVSLDEVYKKGANWIQGDKRQTFLKMIMPYFCEIPLAYLKNYSDNIQGYESININDLIFLEKERRRRVTKIVADEVPSLPIELTTIIAAFYTLIPDKAEKNYYALFPPAPISIKLSETTTRLALNR